MSKLYVGDLRMLVERRAGADRVSLALDSETGPRGFAFVEMAELKAADSRHSASRGTHSAAACA